MKPSALPFARPSRSIALLAICAFFPSIVPSLTSAETVTVAPNLMVILGNSFSMNRTMDDVGYPRYTRDGSNKRIVTDDGAVLCPSVAMQNNDPLHSSIPRFDDYGCNDVGTETNTGRGTPSPYQVLGDQPESKIYIAKKTLFDLLNSSASDGINLGFATFRQAFGLEAATVSLTTNATWAKVYPDNEQTILGSWTDSHKNNFGKDPKNFRNVEWWRVWSDYNRGSVLFGKSADSGQNRWENDLIQPFTSVANGKGLPTAIQYRRFPNGQRGVSCNERTCGQRSNYVYQGNDLASYCQDQSGGTWRCSFGSGGIDPGRLYPNKPEDPPRHELCNTFYNSQGNFFQSTWVADKDFREIFASRSNMETLGFIRLSHRRFDDNGNIPSDSWITKCYDDKNREIRQSQTRITNRLSDGKVAYFTYIPDVFEGSDSQLLNQPIGTFTGWSGKASYDPTTNTFTANYPAGVASDAAQKMGSWNKSSVNHMGVFLDLPDPNAGYVDQRATLKEWVNPSYLQMDPSGLEYDPSQQTIQTPSGDKRSISASTLPGGYMDTQSPIFDSLMQAAAYFKAYKQKDPYDTCRSNNIVLIVDGKEDGRYTYVNGKKVFVDPALAAKKLYEELGVKVFVVIISSNAGNIQLADAIAAAGGTGQAFRVRNAQDLTNALTTVFTSLQGTVIAAGAAVVPSVTGTAWDLVYVPASDFASGSREGHLYAYHLATNGQMGNLAWDAANEMTVALRAQKLLSNKSDGAICHFSDTNCVADSDLQTSSATTPSATDIRSYTLDPSYNGGRYLAGRKNGSLLGTISTRAMKPIYFDHPRSNILAADPSFRAYVQTNSNWNPLVLFSSDDGFLYAVDARSGALQWGWIPRPLLGELKNYTTFQQGKPMDGGFAIGYSKQSGNWTSYLVGTAKSGELHYVLQLKLNGLNPVLDKLIVMDQQANASSPHAAAPTLWNDSDGTGYALYVTNPTTGNGKLTRVRLTDGSQSAVTLPGRASSNVAFSEVAPSGWPAAVAVGLTDGRIFLYHAAQMNTATEVTTASNGGPLDGAVTWLGTGTTFQGTSYLWATTERQIAVYRWDAASVSWKILWKTKAGGPSVRYDANGQATLLTRDPGLTGDGPRWLPTTTRITDASVIDVAQGVLLVPGTEETQQSSCGTGTAKLYLFRLEDSGFPFGAYRDSGGNSVANDLVIGVGEAFSPAVTVRDSDGSTMIIPAAQQNLAGEAKPSDAIIGAGLSRGRVGWREIILE